MTDAAITVILNGYKRPHVLAEQLQAIESQTIKPVQIMFWKNASDATFDQDLIARCQSFTSSVNVGVWGRFALALLAEGEYVCVFDDDTVPAPRWLENCVTSMKKRRGLYGTIGVVFDTDQGYDGQIRRFGWDTPIDDIKQVDIVGHSWFFEKKMLEYFWREIPDRKFYLCGEDMHFSYMLQKYANLPTLVPPHPAQDQSLYGSIPEKAMKYGMEPVAISHGTNCNVKFNDYLFKIRSEGFKLLKDNYQRPYLITQFKFIDVYDATVSDGAPDWRTPYELGLAHKFLATLARLNTTMSVKYNSESMSLVNKHPFPLDTEKPTIYVDVKGIDLSQADCIERLRSKIDLINHGGYYIGSSLFNGATEHPENGQHIDILKQLEAMVGAPVEGKNSIIKLNGSNSTNPDTNHMLDSILFLIIKKI